MTRPTAVLLAVVATVITVPAVLRWGATGFVVVTLGIAAGVGIGLFVDWVTERWPDHPREYDE